LAFQPIYIGSKSDLFLINIHTTNAGAATECRVIDFNLGHVGPLWPVVLNQSFSTETNAIAKTLGGNFR
jgi:hypothetical protein